MLVLSQSSVSQLDFPPAFLLLGHLIDVLGPGQIYQMEDKA